MAVCMFGLFTRRRDFGADARKAVQCIFPGSGAIPLPVTTQIRSRMTARALIARRLIVVGGRGQD
jgi:hypothetical protein